MGGIACNTNQYVMARKSKLATCVCQPFCCVVVGSKEGAEENALTNSCLTLHPRLTGAVLLYARDLDQVIIDFSPKIDVNQGILTNVVVKSWNLDLLFGIIM